MKTVTIGSFPNNIKIPSWFEKIENKLGLDNYSSTQRFNEYLLNENKESYFEKEVSRIIKIHEDNKIDVFTNGEIGRENYIHFILRKWKGIDFKKLQNKMLRNGAYNTKLPVIINKIRCDYPTSGYDWLQSKKLTNNIGILKYTLPGPMTIYDTVVNSFYKNELDCMIDIAKLLNKEILNLQEKGCIYIQLDEPVYARYPKKVIKYSEKLLNICFDGISIHKSLHMCCGYPDKLEETDYLKADNNNYKIIAPYLDNSVIDSISMEDAHCHNDLSTLLPLYKNKIVILGMIKIATVELEKYEDIVERIKEAHKYIDPDRLWISPDCGLAMLPESVAIYKLSILSKAAKEF
jgi:5-methyltetrahydropteroyltriglutamate--homocysteine methyltransferase